MQKIVAFELPDKTAILGFSREKIINLGTDSKWEKMQLNSEFNLSEKKTVLFLYSVNLKVNNAKFSSRLVINNKFSKKSIISIKDSVYASGQAYVVKILPKGKWAVDIEFKTNVSEGITFSGSEFELDHCSLQIIILE